MSMAAPRQDPLIQTASWERLPGPAARPGNSRIGIAGRTVSVGWLRASRRRRPAELAWPGWVRRWVCTNEFESWAAGEAAAQDAATSAGQHLRTVPGTVENARGQGAADARHQIRPGRPRALGHRLFGARLGQDYLSGCGYIRGK
jgi:hypothetical protein